MLSKFWLICVLWGVSQAQPLLTVPNINCTWPCPGLNEVCVLGSGGASCQSREINQWIIESNGAQPIFTGQYTANAFEPCTPLPHHDQYENDIYSAAGSCINHLYCSSTADDKWKPICRPRLSENAVCASSHHCLDGLQCKQGKCQAATLWVTSTKNVPKILAIVLVSILGVILIIVICFLIYRRHLHHQLDLDMIDQPQGRQPAIRPAIITRRSTSSNALLTVGQQYPIDIDAAKNDASLSPIIQQSLLQRELIKSYGTNTQHSMYLKPSSYQASQSDVHVDYTLTIQQQ